VRGAANELIERLSIERFDLEKAFGDVLELLAVGFESVLRFYVRVFENALHFPIDFFGGGFAAVALESSAIGAGHIQAGRALGAVGEADDVAHAEEANHLAGQGGGVFEVVLRAGSALAQHDFLRGTAAEHAANAVKQLGASHEEAVISRQLHGVTEGGAAARDDANFVDWVGVFAVRSDERMADFMISNAALFYFAQAAAPAFRASDDFFYGFFEVGLGNFPAMSAGGEEGGLIDGIGKVCAGEAGGGLGDTTEVHFTGQWFVPDVDFEDGFAAIDVRGVDDNLAIEAAGPEQGPIEDVGPVGRGENDDAGIGGEAVHFNEELVDGLLAFVIDSPDVNAALTSNGVEFVDEDDAWGFCFGLLKQVANAGCADADEHFDKITAADGEERGMLLPRPLSRARSCQCRAGRLAKRL
jgi:hypothetical protein